MNEQLVHLDPSEIKPSSNIRFGLKKSRLDRLKDSILQSNGVKNPISVFLLPEPENGFKYGRITGAYRHEAVAQLNKESKAGLKLPAFIRTVSDAADLVRQQLLENTERENMSPIDTALAIQALRDAGMPNVDICKMFPRPTGKGGKLEPASNAWVNMTADFLKLPKSIQGKIHDGVIGVKAAYELGKAPADKQESIIAKAESDRDKELKAEEDSEKKLADAAAREAKKNKKLIEMKAEAEKLKLAVEEKKKAVEAAKEASKLAYNATLEAIEAKNKTEATKIKEKRKAAQLAAADALKAAEKEAAKAAAESDKVFVRVNKAEENAALTAKKLEQRKKEAAAKKPLSQKDVQAAAKKVGAPTGVTPLTGKDMRDTVNFLALPENPPKMREIGIALRDYFAGIGSDGEMFRKIAKVTGEKWGAPRKG